MKKKKMLVLKWISIASGALTPFALFAQWDPGKYSSSKLPQNSVTGIIENIMLWLLGIFGFIAIVGFLISGIMYLTAAGDEDQQKKAKRQMIWSIMGVIVGLIGLVIIYAVHNMLWRTQGF